MRLSFTRSDLATFALGALAAVLVPLGTALAQLDNDPITDYGTWAMGLLTGIGAALGRYLATAVPQARDDETESNARNARIDAALRAALDRAGPPAAGTVGDIVAKNTREQPPSG